MEEQELIEIAKQKLAAKCYGMFDWVEELMAGTDIINQRPRLLRQKIALLLQITLDEIPYKTFHSWFDRYRKVNRPKGKHKKSIITEKTITTISWKDFKPTELIVKDIEEEPILKRIDYKK